MSFERLITLRAHRSHAHPAHHPTHAAHAADRAAADRRFAQAARDKSRLGKVSSVFEAKFVIHVHRLVADCAWWHLDVPEQQVVRPPSALIARVGAQLDRRLDQVDRHRLALRLGQAVP